MADSVTDHIVEHLRERAVQLFPRRGELRNIRVVGHTPKSDHFIYDLVADFANCSERIAAKVYRPGKLGAQHSRNQAQTEHTNVEYVY